jgi:uncharacterized membrane protein YcaP (DUF421 family)
MDPGAGNLWTFNGGVWWHFVLRAGVVYVMVLVLLRVSGKRQIGQMTPFDLVLLLLISNAVQNAMNGGDNSITAGALLAGTLIGADLLVSWLTRRSRKVETLVEGKAELLIHNGKVCEDALRKADLTLHDIHAALREHDCASVSDVHAAILETDGRISVLTRKERAGK